MSAIAGFAKYSAEKGAKELQDKYMEGFRIKSMNWNVLDALITTPAYFPHLYAVFPSTLVLDSLDP